MPSAGGSWTRRALVGALTALGGIAVRSAAAAGSRVARPPWRPLRRIVTTAEDGGRGIVLYDGEPTQSFELNGTRITRLRETAQVPARLPLRDDAGATAGNAYRPGFAGASFYVAELPGGAHAPDIPMHASTSLDYMAVLSGRVVLAVDDRELELSAGDTIVQGGARHTWINRSDDPCVLLFVVVAASSEAPSDHAHE